jgi:phosphoglycolate phosphatase-like HAD superfamily hydrolase
VKLLLFDIDGTILTSSIGRSAMQQALARCCGRSLSTAHISFAGKTDPQIVREILSTNGFAVAEVAALLPEVLAAYVEAAHQHMQPDAVTILPGIHGLLDHLAERDEVQLALLTGNLEVTAYLKLEAAGLDGYFPFGAFGSDHADRAALPPIAVHRAHTHRGHAFAGKNVVIIGDAENDVRCGRGVGAFSVAVCTGLTDRATLAAEAPDLLLDDLCDHGAFVRKVVLRTS